MSNHTHEGTLQEFARMGAYDKERVAFGLLEASDTTFQALTGEPAWMDQVGARWSRARRKVLSWAAKQLPECESCGDTRTPEQAEADELEIV